jgi:phosphatidylglycerophosphate synthase
MISRDVLIVAIAIMLNLAYGQTRFRPSLWGKITTGSELVTAGLVLLCNHFKWRHPIVSVAITTTLILILLSGFHYLWRTITQVREKGPDPASS